MTHALPRDADRQASLHMRGVDKSYGPLTVVDDVSMTVTTGSRIGVVGANGAGKTTLLRMLAGLEEPDAGTIARSPLTASIGYLPQELLCRAGETVRAYLDRRTGVVAAEAALDAAADLVATEPGSAEEYSRTLDHFLAVGGHDFDARASRVCAQLGLEQFLDHEMPTLSGGQLARASLASILLGRHDIVLLDEPTNDLDTEMLERLEAFVQTAPSGIVIVSHDRAFLDATVQEIVELDAHTHHADHFRGTYPDYEEERALRLRRRQERYDGFITERDRLEARLRRTRERGVVGARRHRRNRSESDKFIRHAKAQRSENGAGAGRTIRRRIDRLDAVDSVWRPWKLQIDLDIGNRSGDIVARLDAAEAELADFVLGPIDLEIRWQDRVHISGANGSGKSTLLRLLLGDITPGRGTRTLGANVRIGALGQGHDEFRAGLSLLMRFREVVSIPTRHARSLLAKYGLDAAACGRDCDTLSPGERTRAGLAVLSAAGANCLVLDEPTNHLDVPAIEELESALADYQGSIILVSHDRRFVENVSPTTELTLAGGEIL